MNLPAAVATKERCSAAEWNVRVDLAACYRLVQLFRLSDLVFNHITAKVPGGSSLPHQSIRSGLRGNDGKSLPGISVLARFRHVDELSKQTMTDRNGWSQPVRGRHGDRSAKRSLGARSRVDLGWVAYNQGSLNHVHRMPRDSLPE